jgi:3-oxoacyl-[acyl-carrier protein] reductase
MSSGRDLFTPLCSTGTEIIARRLSTVTQKKMPLKRVGSAEEVAETAIYLMKNSYTTGVIIQIDGGALLI